MNNIRELAAPPVREGWAHEDQLDLRHYWNVIDRRKWGILALAAIVSLITLLVTLAITPVYQATSTLLIESQGANAVSIEEVYGLDTRAQQYYDTQFEILKSRPLAERVIYRLNLAANPQFAPWMAEEADAGGGAGWLSFLSGDEEAGAAARLDPVLELTGPYLDKLTIAPVRDTQLVHVRYEATNPVLAADIANAHAQSYIESTLDARVEMTQSVSDWMSRRLDVLRNKLRDSERRLQAYREQEQLVDLQGLQSLPAKEIDELSSRLIEARRQVTQAKTAYMQVQQLQVQDSSSLRELSALPGVLNDALVQTFWQATAQAEIQVAELGKRYGPKHPKMIAARSELAAANESLSRHIESVTESIRTRFEEAQQQEVAVSEALEDAKNRYHVVGRKGSELRSLQQEVASNSQLYEMFYNRIKETSQTNDMQPASARIIATAIPPMEPVKPNKKLFVALAFVLSLVLGVIAAFVLDILDNTVKSAEEVEQKLDQPLLGMLPEFDEDSVTSGIPLFIDGDHNDYSESMRTVRTGIALSSLDNPYRTVMVTSSVAGEGKTTTAVNLALAFSQMERVLLIDADMRRPSVSRELDIPRSRGGLAELVSGTVQLDEAIVQMANQQVDVISAGVIPPNPLELLSSRRLNEVLKTLSDRYDRIVIDCPPLLPVSDSRVISTYVDSVVYVVKADATSVNRVKVGLGHLAQTRAPITGIVLNRLDMRKAEKYSDYGYGGYYESYESRPA